MFSHHGANRDTVHWRIIIDLDSPGGAGAKSAVVDYLVILLWLTSQYKAADMKIETKLNTNGCNGTLFSVRSVTEREHISSLNSYSTCIDRRCDQKCCFCDGGDAQSLIIRPHRTTTPRVNKKQATIILPITSPNVE